MAKLVCLMRLGWLAGVAGAVGCGSDSEEPAPDDATVTNGTTSTATGDSATGSTGSAESAGVVVDGTCKLLCADANSGKIRSAPALAFPDLMTSPVLALNVLLLLFSGRSDIDPKKHLEAAKDLLLNGLRNR